MLKNAILKALWRLSSLAHYISRFDILCGLLLFVKLGFWGRRYRDGEIIQVQLPRLRAPLHLRAGSCDLPVFCQIFLRQQYGCQSLKMNPKLILDCGAHIGLASVYFASLFPKSKIYAVEPDEDNYKLLLTNTSAYSNCTCLKGAVWHRKEDLTVANDSGENWAAVVGPAIAGQTAARSYTIAELLERSGEDKIDILKLDVEGAEGLLFTDDCRRWLSRTEVVMAELHEGIAPGCTLRFYRQVTSRPFRQYLRGEILIVDFRGTGATSRPEHNGAMAPVAGEV